MARIRIWNPYPGHASHAHRAGNGGEFLRNERGDLHMAHRKYRVHRHHRRHRNPFGVSTETIGLAAWGVAGGVGALALPAAFLPSQNNGAIGYLLNAGAAVALKFVGDMALGKNAGDGMLIGGLITTGMRIVRENVGAKIPGLSAYWPSFFPVPTNSNPYGQTLNSPYPAPALPAAAGGKAMAGGRFAGGRFRRS